ncbi:NAD-dependent epimerase/dehydratase family protein [Marinoscillum sp.]|uniref:NAD-dependent epimerase/dehydratase family protein n=1 Tax=Marinoscillum sp. TaxID=2024838 RepID=UPI003BABA8AE
MAHVLITGSTGMIGKGVLLECIDDPSIESITLINRSPSKVTDKKIKEVILRDFLELATVKSQLGTPDACFHCMGVSAVGMSEAEYSKLTLDVTKTLADICYDMNPRMTFNYVSGTGTDSEEKSRQMWARVKGRTENYVLAKGFAKAYMFRPGFIIPEKGIESRTNLYNTIYKIMRPFFGFFRKMNSVTTTTRIGVVMIKTITEAPDLQYLENPAINALAKN